MEDGGLARGIHDARYKRLIKALAAARHEAQMSQTELAERLGQRQQFVSKYEPGERRLDFVEILDVAEALGLSLEALTRASAGTR
jgi:transcriptional regulator with XRE-family HTH domain